MHPPTLYQIIQTFVSAGKRNFPIKKTTLILVYHGNEIFLYVNHWHPVSINDLHAATHPLHMSLVPHCHLKSKSVAVVLTCGDRNIYRRKIAICM